VSELIDIITANLNRWEIPILPTIVGSADPTVIAQEINSFCQVRLCSAITRAYFLEVSQGAVFGLQLQDRHRIVIKAHSSRSNYEYLQAVMRAQHYLADQSYPCPLPLLEPSPFMHGLATIEELIDQGEFKNPHDPTVRRSLSQLLAWQIHLLREPTSIPDISPSAFDHRLPPDILWPTPHSPIFNFEATAVGAEWIDKIARKAREARVHGAGQPVLGHADWSAKHVRYVGDQASVIYDWDSLSLEKEPAIVGAAAINFTYTEQSDIPRLPTREEALAFVAEYEAARGKPFSPEEYQTLEAAATYHLAYGSRCEHSLHPQEHTYPNDSCRVLLAQYGGGFLNRA
jgi:hypothetical protein